MDTTLVIATSVLLQLVAAGFVLSQIREVELRRTWLAMAAALLLMCVPRSITLIRLVMGDISHPPALESELMALDVSFLMGVGVAYYNKLFRTVKRAHADLLKSQKDLIESESRLRSLFDNTPDAILVVDKNGVIRNANVAALSLVGEGKPDIVGHSYSEFPLFQTLLKPVEWKAGATPSGAASPSIEATFVNDKGKSVTVEKRGFEMMFGNELCQAWLISDITERQRLKAEAEQLEGQLRHAERLQTVGTLAGGIAHDFNNILTPIVGYTEMAMRTSEKSSVTRDLLEHVIQGALRARDLVKQILAFSRQGARQTIPIKLQSLIAETVALVRASIPTTIEIRTDIDPNCRVVLGDPGQIHQVLMNLCTNAYQAMRDKGGILTIGLCERNVLPSAAQTNSRSQSGPFACLTVKDNGPGIEKETLKRIFEPFFTTKADRQGSGLGLAVVHGIVNAHGGAIYVDSETGRGTTFTAYFPLDLHSHVEHVEPDTYAVRGEARVLIVDDEPVVAELIGEVLRAYGYRVTSRTSSVEAAQAFRANAHDYDIVVTDQTMPSMTGIELAADLKRVRPQIPVILMTGYSEKVSAENFKTYGVDGFLMKPILATNLTQLINKLTAGESVGEAV